MNEFSSILVNVFDLENGESIFKVRITWKKKIILGDVTTHNFGRSEISTIKDVCVDLRKFYQGYYFYLKNGGFMLNNEDKARIHPEIPFKLHLLTHNCWLPACKAIAVCSSFISDLSAQSKESQFHNRCRSTSWFFHTPGMDGAFYTFSPKCQDWNLFFSVGWHYGLPWWTYCL